MQESRRTQPVEPASNTSTTAPHGIGPWAGATPLYRLDNETGVLFPVAHVWADGSIHSFSAAHTEDGTLRPDWAEIAETLADASELGIFVGTSTDADCGDRA